MSLYFNLLFSVTLQKEIIAKNVEKYKSCRVFKELRVMYIDFGHKAQFRSYKVQVKFPKR